MNQFPCKECLIRPCCSQYCNDLIQNPRSIDIYVASSKICPDCGAPLNAGSSFNKTTRICFTCSKVFSQSSFVKPTHYLNSYRLVLPSVSTTSSPSSISVPKISPSHTHTYIIKDITNLNPPKIQPLAMEETHDVLYYRVNKLEAGYIMSKTMRSIKKKIMKPKRKAKTGIKYPPWIDNYNVLFQSDIEPEEGPAIIF